MAFCTTKDALWDCDFALDRLFVSDSHIESFGTPSMDSEGFETWHGKIHTNDREATRQAFAHALKNLHDWEGRYR